jgi:hypothetical protein
MNVRNNDVSVDFTVRVPAGSGFVARTVNGGVQASGLRGRVEAHTVNGSVKLFTQGTAAAETVNGSIDAALGRTDWKDAASFQTVNGSITLALPREASTAVEARTVNGRIAVDFELAGARTSRRELSARSAPGAASSPWRPSTVASACVARTKLSNAEYAEAGRDHVSCISSASLGDLCVEGSVHWISRSFSSSSIRVAPWNSASSR